MWKIEAKENENENIQLTSSHAFQLTEALREEEANEDATGKNKKNIIENLFLTWEVIEKNQRKINWVFIDGINLEFILWLNFNLDFLRKLNNF